MKNKLLRYSLLSMIAMLCGGGIFAIGQALSKAQEDNVVYTFIPQKPSSGAVSDYTKSGEQTVDDVTWIVPGNWYGTGALRIGGKSLDGVDRYIIGKTAISAAVGKITINHKGTTADKITLNSVTLTVATDAAFSKVVETITLKKDKDFTYAKETSGSIDFTPTNGEWDADCYYKFTFNLSNPNSSNYAFVVNSIVFYAPEQQSGPSYYVVGEPSGLGLSWDPEAANKMAVSTTEGVYTKTYEGVVLKKDDKIEYKFKSSEDVWYPSTGGNMIYTVNETATYDVTFTFDVNNFDATATNVTLSNKRHDYYVAGATYDESNTGYDDIFGTGWAILDANKLALDGNVYKKTFQNVELQKDGTVYFQIVADGVTWLFNGNQTEVISETAKFDVTVTYDPSNNTASMIFDKKGDAAPVIASLKDLQESVTEESQEAKLTFNNVIVTAVKGNQAYLADANNEYGALVYLKSHGLEAGQVLNGSSLVNYVLFHAATELTSLNKDALTITTGEVTPTVTTIEAITNKNQSTVVTLQGVTYNATDGVFTDGTNTIKYYDTFSVNPTLEDGVKYDVTGLVVLYDILEIAPLKATDIVKNGYVVAGAVGNESESGKDDILFGKTWDVTANELTADATGILSKTFSNVSFDAATTIYYKIVKNGNIWIPDGANLECDIPEAGKYNITVTFDPTTSTANMTAERLSISNVVLYSWNQGTEHLGKAVASDGESVGCSDAGYTTIRLTGKTTYDKYITITLDKPLKAGDKIAITAYRNKNETGKLSGAQIKFDKGSTTIKTNTSSTSGLEFVNINEAVAESSEYGTEPNTVTLTVPDDADGSTTITMTRCNTQTNLYITKFEITGERDDCYTVAGSSEALFDTKWDAYNVKNELEKQADGTFKLVFTEVTLNKGTIEYKIVKNNATWIPDGDNLEYVIPERGIYDVTVTFDPTTQKANMEAVKEDVAVDDAYVVAGAIKIGNGAEQAGFFTEAWDKEAAANEMEKQTDGTYKKAYEDVTIAEGTTIYYKVVKNGETWIPENENLDYWVKKGGKFNITFTYDPQAQENPITILIEATTAGDANLDGKVTTSDAVAAVSFALEKEEASAEQRKAADFNKNNVITVTDAVAIVNVALEEDPTGAAPMFNAGENFLTLNGTALSLTNSTAFVAFQMDVTLTNGAVLNGVLPTERTQGLTLSYNRIGENTWRIVAFSIEKNAITGNEGDLLTFDITGSKTMAITNIEFADTYAIAYALGFNDGETTGIRPIDNGQLTIDNVIYDLNGRRVQNPSKGVYVINGKKVVIK